MANPEHLAILKQGVKVWNNWRAEKPCSPDLRDIRISRVRLEGANLSGCDLSSAQLPEAYLKGANFRDANLFMADLPDAELEGADFECADLRATNLRRANLQRSNFREATLYSAKLDETDLRDANFYLADLQLAVLRKANLERASLMNTNLTAVQFTQANLRGADFYQAYLVVTELTGAELFEARISQTTFALIDLSEVRGLETVRHEGPSTLGIDTMYKSKGKIPDVFLRGCGLRDWEIEAAKLYDPSSSVSEVTDVLYRLAHIRNTQPFEFYSCFISYSTKDQEFADRLYADLQAKGVRCWFAPHDIRGGRKIHEQIDEAIRLHPTKRNPSAPWGPRPA